MKQTTALKTTAATTITEIEKEKDKKGKESEREKIAKENWVIALK